MHGRRDGDGRIDPPELAERRVLQLRKPLALAEAPAQNSAEASPIFGVTIPPGYRQWELIAPAEEAVPLDELRAVVGNQIAVGAYQAGKLPFPDGSILVKRAWKRKQSPEFASATIPGAATTL